MNEPVRSCPATPTSTANEVAISTSSRLVTSCGMNTATLGRNNATITNRESATDCGFEPNMHLLLISTNQKFKAFKKQREK
jgi:hypothetical protein